MILNKEEYQCSIHGYHLLPDDPKLYEVLNKPDIDKSKLCSKCSEVMRKFQQDFPFHKGNKIQFNITDDMTQKKLLLGRYTHLRWKGHKQVLETVGGT